MVYDSQSVKRLRIVDEQGAFCQRTGSFWTGSRWVRDRANGPQRVGLSAIVLLYLVLGTVYSVVTPVFEAPDESSHFFVIKHLVGHKRLPVQRAGADALWARRESQPPFITSLARSWCEDRPG